MHPSEGMRHLEPIANHQRLLSRANLQALAVPIVYAMFGSLWILVSDLALGALRLPPEVTTRIAMIKGWIFVAGSTALLAVVMRASWSTLARAFSLLELELAERRKAQEDLAALAKELESRVEERTRKLALANQDLSLFTDSVSHDLRAPLRIAAGFSQALREDHAGSLGSEGARLVARLEDSICRMDRMINGLLDLARHGKAALRMQDLDGGHLSERVDEIWKETVALHPGREFVFHRGPLPTVRCDATLVEHVWRNLLSNAAKYTRGRNPATVSVSFRDGWFRVEDDGVGFDPSQAEAIFRPFERLKPHEFEGDGLGLAVASRVVERHGGEIVAESVPGSGTVVRFRLP